jgi:hypothetical protein
MSFLKISWRSVFFIAVYCNDPGGIFRSPVESTMEACFELIILFVKFHAETRITLITRRMSRKLYFLIKKIFTVKNEMRGTALLHKEGKIYRS